MRPDGEEDLGCLEAILNGGDIVIIGNDGIELSRGPGRGGVIPR